MFALARNLGAGIAICVFTAFVARREQFHQDRLAAALSDLDGFRVMAMRLLVAIPFVPERALSVSAWIVKKLQFSWGAAKAG